MQREGVFREMKRRKAYEKPSERKTREKAEAVRRARKAARKQAQRANISRGARPLSPNAQSIPGMAAGVTEGLWDAQQWRDLARQHRNLGNPPPQSN